MAFFTIVPDEYRRGSSNSPRHSKRGIMHVDQVIIQADRLMPNRNGADTSRMRYQDPAGNVYVTDPSYGPPERKRMRRDYSIVSAQPVNYEVPGPSAVPEDDRAYSYYRQEPHVHAYPKRSYNPASSWEESTDSSYSSISQSVADYSVIQEERQERRWTKEFEDGNRRASFGQRNQRVSRKRSSNVAPLYDMSSACNKCCKPQDEQSPVEVQIQECPGLPDMRAYVVVPLGRTGSQNRGQLDQAARRAARAVPPLMRVSRHPQAIVVECNRNNDVATAVVTAFSPENSTPASTTATVSPQPSTNTARREKSREPTPVSTRRQEAVDGMAAAAVAAAAAAGGRSGTADASTTTSTTPPVAPVAPAATTVQCQGTCTLAGYETHGKVPTTRSPQRGVRG